jgi:hypothetical protein
MWNPGVNFAEDRRRIFLNTNGKFLSMALREVAGLPTVQD